MTDITDLYQEVILDHNKNPRNFEVMLQPDRTAEGYNPLCGDKVKLFLKLDGDRISGISFQGAGCAISTASTSIMTEALKGKTVLEAKELFEKVHSLLTESEGFAEGLGKLAVLAGVRQYPMRVKCATLSWHALMNALGDSEQVAVTE